MNNSNQSPSEDEDLSQWEDPDGVAKGNKNIRPEKVRHDIRNRKQNGLKEAGAVLRFGKKHLIHRARYARWLARKAHEAS